ncbi:MAG: hypothetical protein J5725_08725 [Bacteroidales bacterium]|nr:hypothetical protein [Bacteroidales bacterium]
MQDTSQVSNWDTIISRYHIKEINIKIYTSEGTDPQTDFVAFITSYKARLAQSNPPLMEVANPKIISLTTTRSLFTDDKFSIGNCASGEIDLEFFPTHSTGVEFDVPRMARLKVSVRLYDPVNNLKSDFIPKGVFFIDTRSKNKSTGILKIHGFDAMLKTENPFPEGTYSNDPTDVELVTAIANAIGVSVDSRTWSTIDGSFTGIGIPMGYSMREVLSSIAAFYCGNFCISDAGKLLFVSALTPSVSNAVLINEELRPIVFGEGIGGVRILV